jgi:glycosyltransferase involved in cell wall biosynthesis
MTDRERLRVVMLCGIMPLDTRHLEAAARRVNLTIYCSQWLPKGAYNASAAPVDVVVRMFAPIVRSNRGHLVFVYRGLRRALDADRPDVVHVVSEPWGLLAVQAVSWVRANPGARLALHGCDTIWHHGGAVEQWGRRALLRRTLPSTHAWIAESGKALALAARNGLPESSMRARIHTNPRDGTRFRPPAPAERARARAVLEVSPDSVAVGLLGRLVPEKGIRLFLDAADSLLRDGFPGQFFIAGDGPLREEVGRRASSRLISLGILSHPSGVLQLLQALDVLACPSLTTPSWEDQGPRSLLEAMMCGCIPVGTRTGAIPEMLGEHGTLAGSTEPRAVADAIVRAAAMSRDDARRRQLALWAHDLYSADAVAAQLVDLWQAVAAQRVLPAQTGSLRRDGLGPDPLGWLRRLRDHRRERRHGSCGGGRRGPTGLTW